MASFDGFLVSLPAPSFSDALSSDAPIVDGFLVPLKPFASSDAAFFLPEIPVVPGGHILDADTIALWRFDDEQDAGDYTTMRDTSGNGFDLAVGGGTIDVSDGPIYEFKTVPLNSITLSGTGQFELVAFAE